jgi:hypothetical protein
MLPLFWDSEGPILEHYQAEGETVNSEGYRALLTTEAGYPPKANKTRKP